MTMEPGEEIALQDRLAEWAGGALASLGTLSITGMVRAQGGASSETWLVSASIAERASAIGASAEWVLRIQPNAHQVYEDPSVFRQFRMMEAIAAHSDIPVPACIAHEPNAEVLGAPFFLMERIAGDVPAGNYHTEGLWFEATLAAREAMWLGSIEQMAKLNSLDPEPFAFLGFGAEHPADGIAQELARWDSYLDWADIPSYPVLDRARRWLDDHRPKATSFGVAWGDARPCNILFSGQRCAALLDFETASLGGGESDLGWWLFYDHMVTDAIGAPRLEGVGNRAETIAAWEGFVGRRARDMDWHEAFATYRFALIVDRAMSLAVSAGHIPAQDRSADNLAIARLAQLLV